MELINTIHALVRHGEKLYVCECVEIPVVTQGASLDEIRVNLEEAIALFLEDEDPETLGLTPNPQLSVTFQWEPQHA